MTFLRLQRLFSLVGAVVFLVVCAVQVPAAEFGVLFGRVVDINDKPVAGAEVYVYNSEDVKRPGDYISNRTASDGKYRLVLPDGRYWAVARQRSSDAQTGPLAAADKHSGEPQKIEISMDVETEKDFTVANLREAARLHDKKREDYFRVQGRIVISAGPPQKSYVMASSRLQTAIEVPEFLSAWSDEDGGYVLYLPAGMFNLAAAAEFPPAKECVLGQQLNVTSDMTDIEIHSLCRPALPDEVPGKTP